MFRLAPSSSGFISIVLILIILTFTILLGGNFFSSSSSVSPSPNPGASTTPTSGGTCCDNGECDPTTTGQTLTYNNEEYGLLKSQVSLSEHVIHLKDTGNVLAGSRGGPIIINTTQSFPHDCPGNDGTQDKVWGGSNGCTNIKDVILVYVCRENCDTDQTICQNGRSYGMDCFGRSDSIYDIYFRLSDYPTPGVPDVITQCSAGTQTQVNKPATTQLIIQPSPGTEQNLQLKNIQIVDVPLNPAGSDWVSPWCKPAIYLYPEKETDVNVKVYAVGGLTFTLPKYTSTGWDVTAYPNGMLNYLGTNMDYLYYESRIPDKLISEPKEGFVVEYSKLESLFNEILPKLGLNSKESKQFKEYWLRVLPIRPYYFVGMLPNEKLAEIANLNITPNPDSEIRVTLYFKGMDTNFIVDPPKLISPKRQGFTVVEWGGIFKKDKDSKFSCLM